MKKIIAILLIIALIFAFGCTQTNPDINNDLVGDNTIDNNTNQFNNLNEFIKIKDGDNVTMNYTLKLENGEVYQTTLGATPATFDIKYPGLIKGFYNAVIGMKKGDKKTIIVSPEEGYGVSDPSKVVLFDKNDVPDFEEMQVGMEVQTKDGMPGIVISKEENSLVVDFNPFLVGKTLTFEIEIVSIK